MASSLTLTEIDQADLPANAPLGKQIMYLNQANDVAYLRDDQGNDISMTAQNEYLNIVYINQLSDFPDPVANVIELNPGVNTAYYITSVNLDISPNVLKCTGGSTFIKGMHPVESQIVSDSTSPLITCTNGSLNVNDIILGNPNGDIFSFAGNGTTSGFVLNGVLIFGCLYCAQNVTGAIAASFNRCVMLATSTGGFTFTGSTNSQLKLFDNAVGLQSGFLGWTGSFIDLQTATFDLITIAENRVFPGAADTFMTGAASGANIKAGGSAKMTNNIFDGAGSSVTTITGQDDNWLFEGNLFNDGVRNTRSVADTYLSATQLVTISVIGTYVAVAGTNWLSDTAAHFTVSTAGLLTYTGIGDIDIEVISTATVEKVGGGADTLCTQIAIGGTTSAKTISCTDNASPTSVTSHGLFTVSNGNTIQLFVANLTSTANVNVDFANITIVGNMT